MGEGSLRIVVVDDDEQYRRAVVRLLQHRGHDAVGFDDPDVAIAHTEAAGADAVVVDRLLATRDGRAVLRDIRERFPSVVRILATGGDVDRSPDPVVLKPFNVDDLVVTIRRGRR
ncbi:MAG: response regulator [Deltaproteobacteria bacterium]|nr:response regulator [Deltaproteobacteria bacterium]